MPLDTPPAGFNLLAEYQVSPLPWVTASAVPVSGMVHFSFPFVSQWLVLRNDGATTLKLGFTQNGIASSSNYISIATSSSFSANLRLRDVWINGTSANAFTLLAGLTTIQSRFMQILTGSTVSGSLGWPGVG